MPRVTRPPPKTRCAVPDSYGSPFLSPKGRVGPQVGQRGQVGRPHVVPSVGNQSVVRSRFRAKEDPLRTFRPAGNTGVGGRGPAKARIGRPPPTGTDFRLGSRGSVFRRSECRERGRNVKSIVYSYVDFSRIHTSGRARRPLGKTGGAQGVEGGNRSAPPARTPRRVHPVASVGT